MQAYDLSTLCRENWFLPTRSSWPTTKIGKAQKLSKILAKQKRKKTCFQRVITFFLIVINGYLAKLQRKGETIKRKKWTSVLIS